MHNRWGKSVLLEKDVSMPLPLAPIERTIEAFEKAAHEYHKMRLSRPASAKQKKEIDKELDTRLKELDERRRSLMTQADIHDKIAKQQEALGLYQNSNRAIVGETELKANERVKELNEESHSPTKGLRDNMSAVGDIPPDNYCDCHHIVSGVGKTVIDRKTGERQRSQDAIEARATLHYLGLGINDPANGVYLPSDMRHVPHWRFPRALPHANLHTLAYDKMINQKIRVATNELTLRGKLRDIRDMLETGSETFFLTKKSEKKYRKRVA